MVRLFSGGAYTEDGDRGPWRRRERNVGGRHRGDGPGTLHVKRRPDGTLEGIRRRPNGRWVACLGILCLGKRATYAEAERLLADFVRERGGTVEPP
jgi:hypothetical protein